MQFDPTLLPVQPNVGEASIRYGFIDEKHLDHGNETVSVVIDTPFNVLQVSGVQVEVRGRGVKRVPPLPDLTLLLTV